MFNHGRRFGVLLSLIALSACASLVTPKVDAEPEALKPGAYALDETHAALTFKINHLGFSRYVGRFNRFDASLDFDANNPETAQVQAIIEVASLDIANDEFAATLLGPDWFAAEQHPQAVFRSRTVNVTGENQGVMTGDLTLKGVTAPITLDVVFNGGARDLLRGAYVVGFSAKGSFDRTEFGVDRFAGVVGNEVAIEIEAEFIRQ